MCVLGDALEEFASDFAKKRDLIFVFAIDLLELCSKTHLKFCNMLF